MHTEMGQFVGSEKLKMFALEIAGLECAGANKSRHRKARYTQHSTTSAQSTHSFSLTQTQKRKPSAFALLCVDFEKNSRVGHICLY